MTVIQLWNAWGNWGAFSTVVIGTSGGDEIARFNRFEDALRLFGDKKVHAFASDNTKDEIGIAIECD